MPHRVWTGITLAAVMSLTALTGCDSDDPDPTPPRTEPASPGKELTPPGTELSFGETARVTRTADAGTMSLKVVDVIEGTAADLATIGADDGRTPYYLKVEVTPESGDRPIELDEYLGLWADDVPLTHLSVFTDFAPCQELPISVDELDVPQDACLVYVADDGSATPDTVYFDNDDDYSAFDDNAVSWRMPA
ncbi:hypothetical protein [Nocardioides pacificus]